MCRYIYDMCTCLDTGIKTNMFDLMPPPQLHKAQVISMVKFSEVKN